MVWTSDFRWSSWQKKGHFPIMDKRPSRPLLPLTTTITTKTTDKPPQKRRMLQCEAARIAQVQKLVRVKFWRRCSSQFTIIWLLFCWLVYCLICHHNRSGTFSIFVTPFAIWLYLSRICRFHFCPFPVSFAILFTLYFVFICFCIVECSVLS